jgi:hypothetical protein
MENEIKTKEEECCFKKTSSCNTAGGGIYGLAFIGSLIYYLQHAETFIEGFFGFLKALVWPAVFAYKILELLIK